MGRKKLLTKDQVLAAINRWIVLNSVAPTLQELQEVLELGSSRTVLRYLRWLEAEGDIRRRSGARGIQLLRIPKKGLETVPIPIVGEAPAGPFMVAEQNIEGWVRLPKEYVKPPSAKFFLLRVRGDSMNRAKVADDRIEDGDLVLVRQQQTADPGEVVVAVVDGEATIKRLAKGPGYYLLRPESSSEEHQPILVGPEFSVQGVVRRILKTGSDLLNLTYDRI